MVAPRKLSLTGDIYKGVRPFFVKSSIIMLALTIILLTLGLSSDISLFLLSNKTRPVWTGFKIAVRPKLLTHYYKVRCLDTIIICNSQNKNNN